MKKLLLGIAILGMLILVIGGIRGGGTGEQKFMGGQGSGSPITKTSFALEPSDGDAPIKLHITDARPVSFASDIKNGGYKPTIIYLGDSDGGSPIKGVIVGGGIRSTASFMINGGGIRGGGIDGSVKPKTIYFEASTGCQRGGGDTNQKVRINV